jgi:outer membrane protein
MKALKRAAFAALMISMLAAPLASAQAKAPAPVAVSTQAGLDVATARALALANSAALKKAQLAVDAAALAGTAQVYQGLPSVTASAGGSLDYGYSGSIADALGATAKVSASQTVFDGGKQSALAKKANLATDAARADLRAVRVELIGTADAAFYSVLKAAASLEAAEGDVAAARLRLQIAKAKMDAGVVAASEYLMTESEAAAYETSLIKAKKTLNSAKAKLASLTGLPASTALMAIDFSVYDGILGRLAALDDAAAEALASGVAALAAAGNPALAGYALALEQAKLSERAAMAGFLPTVSASLSQGLGWDAGSGLSIGAGSVSVTASMKLDLWATSNAVSAASTAAAGAALSAGDGARSLALDIEVAVNELLGAVRSISSSAKALEYADSNYRNALERFTLSSASASELSSAEALVSANRLAVINARYDFISCVSTLRSLAGLESDDAILALVP